MVGGGPFGPLVVFVLSKGPKGPKGPKGQGTTDKKDTGDVAASPAYWEESGELGRGRRPPGEAAQGNLGGEMIP